MVYSQTSPPSLLQEPAPPGDPNFLRTLMHHAENARRTNLSLRHKDNHRMGLDAINVAHRDARTLVFFDDIVG